MKRCGARAVGEAPLWAEGPWRDELKTGHSTVVWGRVAGGGWRVAGGGQEAVLATEGEYREARCGGARCGTLHVL